MPTPPSWFRGRQGKIEEVTPDLVKLTGPNLIEAHIGVRKADNGRWASFVRAAADGPDQAATEPIHPNSYEAWEAAFEIYRNLHVN